MERPYSPIDANIDGASGTSAPDSRPSFFSAFLTSGQLNAALLCLTGAALAGAATSACSSRVARPAYYWYQNALLAARKQIYKFQGDASWHCAPPATLPTAGSAASPAAHPVEPDGKKPGGALTAGSPDERKRFLDQALVHRLEVTPGPPKHHIWSADVAKVLIECPQLVCWCIACSQLVCARWQAGCCHPVGPDFSRVPHDAMVDPRVRKKAFGAGPAGRPTRNWHGRPTAQRILPAPARCRGPLPGRLCSLLADPTPGHLYSCLRRLLYFAGSQRVGNVGVQFLSRACPLIPKGTRVSYNLAWRLHQNCWLALQSPVCAPVALPHHAARPESKGAHAAAC